MKAKRCDRCGKFYIENKNKYREKYNGDPVSCIILGTCTNRYMSYDLCDECVNELMHFLNNVVRELENKK